MGKIYKENEEKNNDNNNEKDVLINIGELVERPDNEIKFRDKEIGRVYDTMNRLTNRAVLLVGDYGIGKRSVIEGYVNKLNELHIDGEVVDFDFLSVFYTVRNRADFEDNLKNVFSKFTEVNGNSILNINNLGHLLNFNCFENGGYVFVNSLLKSIEVYGLRVIATTTTKEYSDIESHFPKVLDYFTTIKLTELTKEQSSELLVPIVSLMESVYNIKLPEDISETISECADKYVRGKVFPRKAEDLLDEMCASISRKHNNDPKIQELIENGDKLKNELLDAIEGGDIMVCDEIDSKINENHEALETLNRNRCVNMISKDEVLEIIGEIVNVPMTKLSKDKTKFLKNLPDEIKKDIIGQDETVDKIVKNIRRNQLGLRKKAHSAGNYIFIGSTGVGKTALAKSLAKNLFGSEENILRFDMSEFQTEIDVTKLLGSAPGYVGYKESGLLVKGLAKKPECVCLFDEIEKAHPKVYDVLLQLLDEGNITGSDGVKVDGSRALIIFTSNIGVKSAKELSNPMGFNDNYDELKLKNEESIMRKALKNRFSPEFLNRLDSICYFNNLSRDVLSDILQKEIREMNNGIKNIIHKEIVLGDDVRLWLLDRVEKEHNGARPIIRLIEQEIEEYVADLVIDESPILDSDKNILYARLDNEKIVLE